MAISSKSLLTSVTAPGAGTAQDLAGMFRSLTMQVIPGGATPDNAVVVKLEGSLDNVSFFGMGQRSGPGPLSVDEDVVQYVRANVVSIASGNVTAYLAYISG